MVWLKENPEMMEHFKKTVLDYITNKSEEMELVSETGEELDYDPETGEIFE